MVPYGSYGIELETTVYRPPGEGPFPLVVINHGKSFGDSRFQPRSRYPLAALEFVRRGYVVAIPMRRGFSKSGGIYIGGGQMVHAPHSGDVVRVAGIYSTSKPVSFGRL